MKALLCNTHDIILLLCIGTYLLLGSLGWADVRRSRQQKTAWVAFFVINALIASYTLIYWSPAIRDRVFDAMAFSYPLLIANYLLVGPALLAMVQTSVGKSITWNSQYLWHLCPAILAITYLYWACFRFDLATQHALFLDLKLYSQPGVYYHTFITLLKLFPLGYGVFAIFNVARNSKMSLPRDDGHRTALLVTLAFSSVWAWETITHFIGRAFPGNFSDFLGITANYLKFVVALVILVEQLKSQQKPMLAGKSRAFNPPRNAPTTIEPAHVEAVMNAMQQQQVFLNSQLTLERFAEKVQLSPREVSCVINRKFQQNFHEFINSYRIDVAKDLLRDTTNEEQTIGDIAQAAGFNSKATFNRFFKKFVLVTPSEYRKKHQKNRCS